MSEVRSSELETGLSSIDNSVKVAEALRPPFLGRSGLSRPLGRHAV